MLHASLSPSCLQRVRGRAEVALADRGGRTRITRLIQEGSAKAFLPSVYGAEPEVVFLNTAGGLTGGDRLGYALALGPEVAATGTTQTAERAYASAGGRAEMSVRLAVGAGGRLDWLPQETILYDRAALVRRTEIELAEGAACLLAEVTVLGRAAMGEDVRRLAFRDTRLVRRGDRPVFLEPLALDDGVLAAAGGAAVLGGARAVATAVLVAPGAEAAAAALARLPAEGVEAAASGWDGKCVLRILGGDGWPVRRHLARALEVLREGRPLPRVWQT